MSIVIPETQLADYAELITNNKDSEDLTLKLFQNNLTPTSSVAIGDITEATFSGYAAAALTAANWGFTPSSTTIALYNTGVVFESDANAQNQDIYGYYLVGTTSGDLKWIERFSDGPYTVDKIADKVTVTPRITTATAGS